MKVLKNLMLALGVLGLSVSGAKAATEVDEVINSSVTHLSVNVSSYVAGGSLQVFSASLSGTTTSWLTVLEGRKGVEIQNLSTSADVFCRIGISSTSANGDLSLSAPTGLSTSQGQKLLPGGFKWFALRARDNDGRVFVPFCVNNGGSGTVALEVTQVRSK